MTVAASFSSDLKYSWGGWVSKSHYSPTMGLTAPRRRTFFTALRFINRIYSAGANAYFPENKYFLKLYTFLNILFLFSGIRPVVSNLSCLILSAFDVGGPWPFRFFWRPYLSLPPPLFYVHSVSRCLRKDELLEVAKPQINISSSSSLVSPAKGPLKEKERGKGVLKGERNR